MEYRRAFSELPAAVPCSSRAPPSTTRTASAASAHLGTRAGSCGRSVRSRDPGAVLPRHWLLTACAALLCEIAPPPVLSRSSRGAAHAE